jgi:hypothetical protein
MKHRHYHCCYLPSLITCLFSLCLSLHAADLIDAPGPGYRKQAEQLLNPNGPTRAELTPAQVYLLRERFGSPQIRMLREQLTVPLPPSSTLPELPHTKPFDKPIRLFDRATQ